ncbi:MAG: hypothetical protein NXI24_00885 [bacterium]|nr:hypothetical protein [bacterium]
MKDREADAGASSARAAGEASSAEEIPLKVHDYARACRSELERLQGLQSEADVGYQAAREAVARLESLAGSVHPLLAEKIRRVAAIVRRMGQEPAHNPAKPQRFESLFQRLAEIQDSPLWALPAAIAPTSGASAANARSHASARSKLMQSGPVLKPGEIFPDRVVFYMLGDLRFMVRGTLKYNLHRADLSRAYATRRGGPLLPIFPNAARDTQAFPAPSSGGNLMVFAAPARGEGGCLGLRYDRILAIEDFAFARHERGVEALHKSHEIVSGRLVRGGDDYYVIQL